ncbi:unnamed protein product [Moneuplotes crassus]|uniref:Uncharacterized protein n=1 Tax=Euplotes crassus TaxID=5936 RepID=A0AAD1XK62_EUPCR|nr:unnamed protein product [Moneuplotes crassus]
MIERIIKLPTLEKKIAIIQNEFSENMGIEAPLMTNAQGEVLDEFYEMPNGCICCSVKDDLVNTLELLIESKPEIEHIFIETNGLADPANIIKIFWLDDGLMSNLELNYTMGVIDAKNFAKNIEDSETCEALKKQLIHADKILINKVDLATTEEIENIISRINSFNPLVELKQTEYANADLDYLIETPEKIKNFTERYSESVGKAEKSEGELKIHSHTAHSAEISPSYIITEGILNLDNFEVLMGKLHWESEVPLLRCKGLFHARDCDEKLGQYLLQGVDDTFECRLIKPLLEDHTDFENKFLFVGKDIDAQGLKEKINSCC